MNGGGKLVKIKEERGSRPQLDLKEFIGTYDFGVVPRYLFASGGTVFLAFDKAKILHHIELLVSNEQLAMHTPAMKTSASIASNNENGQEMESSESTHAPDVTREGVTRINDTSSKYKVIIIDAMALVNAIPKTDRIKICNDFAQVFLDQLSNMAGDSDKVRLIFDIYINTSQRTNGQRGYLHITMSRTLP